MVINRLKDVLKAKGRTIYWLAKETRVSWQNLKKIESGKTTGIKFDLLDKLCQALDCQPGDLFEYKKRK